MKETRLVQTGSQRRTQRKAKGRLSNRANCECVAESCRETGDTEKDISEDTSAVNVKNTRPSDHLLV